MNNFRLQSHFQAKPRFSNKLPALYLDSLRDPEDVHHLEIYLVNNSSRTLEFVASPQPMLLISSLAHAPIEDDILYYENVSPGEAVKIADFDEIFDSDFVHQIQLLWQYPDGPAHSATITGKGIRKFTYRVLEWIDHE